MTIFLIFIFFFFNYSFADQSSYNVLDFGAKADGKSDCTQNFLNAWKAACNTKGPATINVPEGGYLLSKTVFNGNDCNNQETTIQIDGTLILASSDNIVNWLTFQQVTGLTILRGKLDGQGRSLWDCKTSGKKCPQGATSLGVYNSHGVTIDGLMSSNSQMFHIIVYGSHNINLLNTKISAPDNSPNTDGIHIEQSSDVTIMSPNIRTGDDCVSIGPGSTNIWIEKISCGPGHGVSIGSLGKSSQEAGVKNVTVKTATFTGTQNGVRIKTWARPSNGFVKDVLFQHIVILGSQNPILIDQNYCPGNNNCPNEGSGVQISDITYEDVHGTSASQVAVRLGCSKTNPCTGINLEKVQLTNNKQATASCDNAFAKIASDVSPRCNQ